MRSLDAVMAEIKSKASRKYYDDCMCNFVDISDGEKPVMVVSSGKSTLAYEICVMMADRANLSCHLGMLRCEDGKMHEHAFISQHLHDDKYDLARVALDLVFQHKESTDFTRANFQYQLGHLLGYPLDEILDFIAGSTARNCPCDCCGGPFVPEEYFDTMCNGHEVTDDGSVDIRV